MNRQYCGLASKKICIAIGQRTECWYNFIRSFLRVLQQEANPNSESRLRILILIGFRSRTVACDVVLSDQELVHDTVAVRTMHYIDEMSKRV